jgi:hypothetical protein
VRNFRGKQNSWKNLLDRIDRIDRINRIENSGFWGQRLAEKISL